MTMTDGQIQLATLVLVHGGVYTIELQGGAQFHGVRWDRPLLSFMLNARGGVPLRFTERVRRTDDDALWFDYAQLRMAAVPVPASPDAAALVRRG
jgi:hypothetical protein